MARPKIPSQKQAYANLRGRINQYSVLVQKVFDQLNVEAAKIVTATGYDGTKPFRFKDYPQTAKAVQDLQTKFVGNLRSVIYSSTSREWKECNLLQDLVADKAMKFYGVKTKSGRIKKYYQTNSDALKAFQERKDKGMNLSTRLWNQSSDYKEELECAISSAVQKGTSAVALSKRLSKYLNDFDTMKDDYKEKFGRASKPKNCEYRSIRLARTEINMAYRTAEQKRWEQFDFVVGYEIKLSGGHKIKDICDRAKGKYPKTFKFSGWHPNCFCYCIPILKTEDEFWDYSDAPSENTITDIPEGFKEYLDENKARISEAKKKGTLPYWAEDNKGFVFVEKSHALRVADARHAARTEEDIKNIKTRFENWRKMDSFDRDQYSKIYRWKDSVGLDTSTLERLMVKHNDGKGLDYELWSEMVRLENRVDSFMGSAKGKLDAIREEIFYNSDKYPYQIRKLLQEKYDALPAISPQTIKDAEKAYDEWFKYKKQFTEGVVDVVKPSYSDIWATNDSLTFDEEKEILRALCGTKKNNHYGFKDILEKYESATGDTWDLRQELYSILKKDEGAIWSCIDDLTELGNAKDLNKIPKYWRLKFNDYMERIRAFDIEANGYAGVYKEIEGAYNIYKLSTMEEVRAYGIKKLNANVPHQIFEIWKKEGWDMSTIPNPNLFYYLDDYVPWYTKMNLPVDDWTPRSSAHFHPRFGHVSISETFFSDGGRGYIAPKKRVNIFYHEYGHANDSNGLWKHREKIAELFDKYEEKYNAMTEQEIRDKFWKVYDQLPSKLADKFFKKNPSALSYIDDGTDELSCAFSDVIQSLRKDKLMVNGGHFGTYFDNRRSRFAEFIAHMSEEYWQGNEFLEMFDREMARDFKNIMKLAYSKDKNALGKIINL